MVIRIEKNGQYTDIARLDSKASKKYGDGHKLEKSHYEEFIEEGADHYNMYFGKKLICSFIVIELEHESYIKHIVKDTNHTVFINILRFLLKTDKSIMLIPVNDKVESYYIRFGFKCYKTSDRDDVCDSLLLERPSTGLVLEDRKAEKNDTTGMDPITYTHFHRLYSEGYGSLILSKNGKFRSIVPYKLVKRSTYTSYNHTVIEIGDMLNCLDEDIPHVLTYIKYKNVRIEVMASTGIAEILKTIGFSECPRSDRNKWVTIMCYDPYKEDGR